MKRLLIILLATIFASSVFAQKKEELVQRISKLEASVIELQGKVDNFNASIKNQYDANTLLENKISLLENKIGFQENIIKSQAETLQQIQNELGEQKKQHLTVDSLAALTNPQNEEDSINSVVIQYYGAKKWEDILRFVYSPERVKPLMQKAYSNGKYSRVMIDKNTISIPDSGYKVGDKFIVTVSGYAPLYMRNTTDGLKVDWEAGEGYNSETLFNYKTRKGTDKIIVRISISPQNLVTSKYDSYGVGSNYYKLYGEENCYFQKSSSVGQRISQMLKDGYGAKITVEVQGKIKRSDTGEEGYFIFINRIVSEDWFSTY